MSLVLVVDDDLDLLNLYIDLLEEMGLEVISALDGVDALRLAIERKPQLVLTDWRMPRMDGIELCKVLKRSTLLSRTRLILHSSEAIPEPWCADACLRKPTSLATLEAVVKAMLKSPQGRTVALRAQSDSLYDSGAPAM